MDEFNRELGDPRKGMVHAMVPLAVLIVLPIVIFAVLNSGSSPVELTGDQSEVLQNILLIQIILGSITTVFGFLRGFYPKGTRSRLLFSLIEVEMLVLTLFALYFLSGLPGAVDALDMEIPLSKLFLLTLFPLLWLEVSFYTEHIWFRNCWLGSQGVEVPKLEIGAYALRTEFDPRLGVIPEANKSSLNYLIMLTIAPALLLLLVAAYIVNLDAPSLGLLILSNGLAHGVDVILLLGSPLFFVTWFYGYYKKGSFGRLTFGLIYSGVLVLYLFLILWTSDLQQGLDTLGIDLDYYLVVILLLFVPVFIAISSLGECVDERLNWKKEIGLEVTIKEINYHSWWIDLNPRIGKIGQGVKMSLKAYVIFLLMPAITLTFLAGTMDKVSDPDVQELADAVRQMFNAIILTSVVIVVLSFFRGFYPKGTVSRLSFGMGVTIFIMLLVYLCFLDGELERKLSAASIAIDLDPVLFALLFFTGMGFVHCLSEFVDELRNWRVSIRKPVRERVPEKKEDWKNDFRVRHCLFVKGAKEARKFVRKYVVWPTLTLVLILAMLYELTEQGAEGLEAAQERILSLLSSLPFLALPIIIIQFIRGSYPKGSVSRLSFGVLAALAIALWYYVVWGGVIDTFTGMVGDIEQIATFIQMFATIILIILFTPAIFKLIWYVIEYILRRGSWEQERERPEMLGQASPEVVPACSEPKA